MKREVNLQKVNKIALSASNLMRLQMHDGVNSYPLYTGAGRVCKAELTDYTKNKKLNIMTNFDDVTGETRQQHNQHWGRIPDHPYRILIVRRSGSGMHYLI